MGFEGVKIIMNTIANNKSIVSIDFSFSNIASEGITLITDALKKNSSIVKVNLTDVLYSHENVRDFIEVFKTNYTLLSIQIGQYGKDGETAFEEYLERNRKEHQTKMNKYKISDLPTHIHVGLTKNVALSVKSQSHKSQSHKSQSHKSQSHKPKGLYYGKNIEWLFYMIMKLTDWEYDIDIDSKYVYIDKQLFLFKVDIPNTEKVTFDIDNDSEKIITLNSFDDIIHMSNLYGYYSQTEKCNNIRHIDWRRLQKDYGGMEINNYEIIIDEYEQMFKKKLKQKYINNNFTGKRRDFIWFMSFGSDGGCAWNIKNHNVDIIHPE
jgi:hypothetical protein